jgi:hypothetical protein
VRRGLSLALAAGLGLAGCAGPKLRRFPDRPPILRVDDRRPYTPKPESFYSPYIWDGANYSVFRPLSRYWLFETPKEARDVNAMDEVPSSSWYVNRLSAREMTPDEIYAGACDDPDDAPKLPWTVVGGKPDGANPGFQAKDATGKRFLVKVDGVDQPERATTADVVGALIFHAAGYWVPCNRVVQIRKEDMTLKEGAEVRRTNGTVEPLTQETIDAIMSKATEVEPGLYRVSLSEFISGRPISPWRYEGLRKDDLNDTIPHEHRRSLRAMRLLAAWIDHVDTRQENTMLAWMQTSEDGRGYTRHYRIDFGEAFGIVAGPDGIPQRLGHAGYFDLGQMSADFVTLGLQDRPWYDAEHGPAGEVLGYYAADDFDPEAWVPGYPNPAFINATEADHAWMARIMARFTPAHIQALVDRAHIRNRVMADEIVRIMTERRRKTLERYLTRLSPLTDPDVDGRTVCLEDRAVWSRIRDFATRRYAARGYVEGGGATDLSVSTRDEARVCVGVPVVDDATPERPRYVVVDVVASSVGRETTGPARLHFYDDGRAPRLVGSSGRLSLGSRGCEAGHRRDRPRAEPAERRGRRGAARHADVDVGHGPGWRRRRGPPAPRGWRGRRARAGPRRGPRRPRSAQAHGGGVAVVGAPRRVLPGLRGDGVRDPAPRRVGDDRCRARPVARVLHGYLHLR